MRTPGHAQRPAERAALAVCRNGAALVALLLAACASLPRSATLPAAASPPAAEHAPAATLGTRVAAVAQSQLGTPYLYGGTGRGGFDCSGLVFYAHAAVGLRVPRTVAARSAAARPVPAAALAVGDLVFFHLHDARVDHVGIYAGDGRFVHAPARGRRVRLASLNDPYYAARYAGAGRLWAPAATAGRLPP